MTRRLCQHERPSHFRNLWVVGGFDETPYGGMYCEVMGYEDRNRVRVRFVDRTDLFQPETALLSPFELFPVLDHERAACATNNLSA